MSRDGKYLYVCASNDHAVQVIDRATGKVLYDLPSGEDPEQFALVGGRPPLFAANERDAAVTAIDIPGRRVAFQVDVGIEPEGWRPAPTANG